MNAPRVAPAWLVIAAGRGPDVEALGLDEAGVELDDRGLIAVDGRQRTSREHVYAIGDLVRGPALAHKSSDEGIIAVEDAAGMQTHALEQIDIPRATFCAPNVASFGLTEEQAREKARTRRRGARGSFADEPTEPVDLTAWHMAEVVAALGHDSSDRSADVMRVVGVCVRSRLTLPQTRWVVRSREDLEAVGAVDAFMRVKRAGFRPSLNLLYALEGALLDCHWQDVPEARRTELVAAAEADRGRDLGQQLPVARQRRHQAQRRIDRAARGAAGRRDAARHGRRGPIPIRNRSRSATGTVLRLKNGDPTETFPPVTASASRG